MPEERLTDIDSELRALLAVEPSAEFAVRVRQRVGAERMALGLGMVSWRPAWAWAAVAAVVVLVVGAIALRPSTGVSVPAPPPLVVAAVPPVSPRSGVEHLPPVANAVVAGVRRAAPRTTQNVVAGPEPEVLIDARQTAGMKRLLEMVRAGTALKPADGAGTLDAPIAVEPLRVPALTIDSAGGSLAPGRFDPNDFQPTKE